MRCVSCGSENPAGMKFCGDCAAPLRNGCPRCNFENPPGFKFCGNCGAPLGAQSAAPRFASERPPTPAMVVEALNEIPEGERKTVTALFADIKGSMDLLEDLDPEQARAIVDPALALMIGAAHRYDGYIVQSTGDGVFALFGAPVAYEDHPQRALYAALRMQEEMRKYAARLREAGDPPVEIRIGVNTGEAVIRSIQTGAERTEYTPIGHAMGLAARMQTLAPSGSIVVAEPTQKLVSGYFETRPLGAARIKGVSEPLEVFEVVGVGALRTRLQRAASRGFSRFVGRRAELERIRRAAALAAGGDGQIVAAVADAGVGKSRLFHEFRQTGQSGWLTLEAYSSSYGRASAYLPIIDLMRGYFGVAAADDERARREKVTGKLLALDRSLEDALPFVFALLGISGAESAMDGMNAAVRRQRTHDAIKRILMRESLNQPLMVMIEDLHWIDEESRALLDYFAGSIGAARILLMVNYRPGYAHDWRGRANYAEIALEPLGAESARELVDTLVGDGADLEPLKRLIIERTEGNPLFIEEMFQALLEQGVLVRNLAGAVALAKPLQSIRVPPTVKGILAARIDRLAPAHKDLLQTLAVVGKQFRMRLARRVARIDEAALSEMLAELQAGEFIFEQPAPVDAEYSFKHALTQEVAYDSLLLERRRQIHERAAAAIEELYAANLDDHLADLANHYERGGNAQKAIDYFERAAEQARLRSAYDDAIRNVRAALALVSAIPDSRTRAFRELRLYSTFGMALLAVRGYLDAEFPEILRRAADLTAQLGDTPEIVPVLIGLWGVSFARGNMGESFALAERIDATAFIAGDPLATAGGHVAIGATALWSGDPHRGRERLESAIAIYDADIDAYLPMSYAAVVPSRCHLAWALWVCGYPDQSRVRAAEARRLAERLGRPFSIAMALQYAIAVGDLTGDYSSLRANCEALLETSRAYGFPQWLGAGEMSLGRDLIESGAVKDGFAMLSRGLETLRAAGGDLVYRYGLLLLAGACLVAGEFERGLAAIDECASYLETAGARMYEAELWRMRGALLLRGSENHAEAARMFRAALGVARAQGALSWELRAATSYARMLAGEDRRDEASAALAPVYARFTEGFGTRDLQRAETLLAQLRS